MEKQVQIDVSDKLCNGGEMAQKELRPNVSGGGIHTYAERKLRWLKPVVFRGPTTRLRRSPVAGATIGS